MELEIVRMEGNAPFRSGTQCRLVSRAQTAHTCRGNLECGERRIYQGRDMPCEVRSFRPARVHHTQGEAGLSADFRNSTARVHGPGWAIELAAPGTGEPEEAAFEPPRDAMQPGGRAVNLCDGEQRSWVAPGNIVVTLVGRQMTDDNPTGQACHLMAIRDGIELRLELTPGEVTGWVRADGVLVTHTPTGEYGVPDDWHTWRVEGDVQRSDSYHRPNETECTFFRAQQAIGQPTEVCDPTCFEALPARIAECDSEPPPWTIAP